MLKFIQDGKRQARSCSMYSEGGLHLAIVFVYSIVWQKLPCDVLTYDRARKKLVLYTYKHTYTHMCLYILIDCLHILCVEVDSNIGIYKLAVFQTYFLFFFFQFLSHSEFYL